MQHVRINFFARPIITACITFAAATAAAQDGAQTRSITSDDFASKRPVKTPRAGTKKVTVKPNRYTYKFVRADKNVVPSKGGQPAKPSANAPAIITEIGVTMWKLRPPRPQEYGFLLNVLDETRTRRLWLAERIGLDTVFKAGDKVRFAIESSNSGYLYVIGRETYADGSLGAPYPVFPLSQTDDNSVRSGMLVDIPDQREDLPYFNMTPKKADYTGELLTVLISPKPLSILRIDKDGNLQNSEGLTELEFGAEAEIFSRVDKGNKIYSKAESESACGIRTRELRREKSTADPCGVATRQLTREEPLPQSIYRVKGFAGQPAVAFIKLAVRP